MGCAGYAAFAIALSQAITSSLTFKPNTMYGLIGTIEAKPGERDNLINILLEGISGMPGCLSFIVSEDVNNENVIRITEVWDSEESHRASLSLPSVQEAISKGRPHIDQFGERIKTKPVGGHGLVKA